MQKRRSRVLPVLLSGVASLSIRPTVKATARVSTWFRGFLITGTIPAASFSQTIVPQRPILWRAAMPLLQVLGQLSGTLAGLQKVSGRVCSPQSCLTALSALLFPCRVFFPGEIGHAL
jgi:hypothetical protein